MQPPDESAQAEGRDLRSPRAVQMDLLVQAYGDEVGKGPKNWREVGIQYLYRQNEILVRDEYLDHVLRIVPGSEVQAPLVHGVSLLSIPGPVIETLERIRGEVGAGDEPDRHPEGEQRGAGAFTPNHLVSITPPQGTGGGCPATEPDPVDAAARPEPGPTIDARAGQGVRVVVIDSGLDPDAPGMHPWMDGVTGDPDPAVPPGPAPNRPLDLYAGHGTFIAGIVRCMAPRAEVIVKNIVKKAGATFEANLVRALDRCLDDDFPDVISMSAGTWTFDPTGLLSLTVFNERRFRHHKGVVLVAAAGNDNSRRPFWPAAATWAIGAGALDRHWRDRAEFSNFGGWVDVYAPGERLVNAFPVGTYTYREPSLPHHVPPHQPGDQAAFQGMARWSGTSFSTPMVAGMIAARMSHTGENGRGAGAALVAQARDSALFGVGAALLPR